jgi:hypothetical protein
MAWGKWGSGGFRKNHSGNGDKCGASETKSYHNGGVEGDSFSSWYKNQLAEKYLKDGDGADGTKGSGSGGTKGSGSGGTKGSGSGGTKGSGSGGTKGSGSGGTRGSGSGGTNGSNTGGTGCNGTGSEPTPPETDGKTTKTFTLGTDPAIEIEVTQTAVGQLFINLDSKAVDGQKGDIDALLFNLSDDVDLQGLHFYPDPNALPVTGHDAAHNAVSTLPDGTPVPGTHDAVVQFGQMPDSTDGEVHDVNFTLWSETAPLSLDDIDLSQMTLVVTDADGNQQILTGGEGQQAASSTDSYHNGGVKGDSFDKWYEGELGDKYCGGSGSGGTKGSGSGGTRGSGSGGTRGSGSGGTKGSGSGGTKGSGSGGTRGSGSGGTKGSGSGGTKGSGSGGTKGSGSGGTKGSGSGGTRGSGSGGTRGSGSGGTKGSGSGNCNGGSGSTGGLPKFTGEPKDSGKGDDIVYASGSGGSGSGGTKGSGSGGTGGIMSLLKLPPEKEEEALSRCQGTGNEDDDPLQFI